MFVCDTYNKSIEAYNKSIEAYNMFVNIIKVLRRIICLSVIRIIKVLRRIIRIVNVLTSECVDAYFQSRIK